MARIERSNPLTRTEVISARGRIHFKRGRGDQIIGQAWPKRRGKKQTAHQKAWTDEFAKNARLSKTPDSAAMSTATNLAGCTEVPTGWFYRDVIESALRQKLHAYTNGGRDGILGGYDETGQRLGTEVIPRVTTPTAFVKRTSDVSIPSNTDTKITFQSVVWDNNNFFSAAAPTRLTIRAPGLYFIGANANIAGSATNGLKTIYFTKNGAGFYFRTTSYMGSNNAIWFSPVGLMWFEANDYVEAFMRSNGVTSNCTFEGFYLLAMTPESLL